MKFGSSFVLFFFDLNFIPTSCCQKIEQCIYFRYQVLESGTIEIADVRTADSGMYQCFASNDAGEVNAATWLKILSKSNTVILLLSN